MYKRCLLPLFLSLGVLFLLTGIIEARQYRYHGLEALPSGTQSQAWALNDKGQITGWAGTASAQGEQGRAVFWNLLRTTEDLGAGNNSCAMDINNLGQIVGVSLAIPLAFLWNPTSQIPQYLVNNIGGTGSQANAINDRGQLVGYAETSETNPETNEKFVHAFLWESAIGGMQDLGTLGGKESWANDINFLSQIAGTSRIATGEYRAFLRDPATGVLNELGTLAQSWTAAMRINNRGQVVGWSLADTGFVHAFLLTPGEAMQDLGTLTGNYSQALDINDQGQVVGEFGVTTEAGVQSRYAFLWTATNGMQDLNASNLVVDLPAGISLACADGINRSGCIVGYTSANRAFLLTPIAAMPFLQILLQD